MFKYFVASILVCGLLAYFLKNLEQSLLFQPFKVSIFDDVFTKNFVTLPSGGGLVHYDHAGDSTMNAFGSAKINTSASGTTYTSADVNTHTSAACGNITTTTTNAISKSRRLLFLHGNGGCVPSYENYLAKFKKMGYDVYALEYTGYMPLYPPLPPSLVNGSDKDITQWRKTFTTLVPNADAILQNLVEAWQIMGDPEAIIVGFSLGGGLLGMKYDELYPAPAQIVFLNTFSSLPALVSELVYWPISTIASRLMETKWKVKKPQNYTGNVLVVNTLDDELMSEKHSADIVEIFNGHGPKKVSIPYGNHNGGPLMHWKYWTSHLLL